LKKLVEYYIDDVLLKGRAEGASQEERENAKLCQDYRTRKSEDKDKKIELKMSKKNEKLEEQRRELLEQGAKSERKKVQQFLMKVFADNERIKKEFLLSDAIPEDYKYFIRQTRAIRIDRAPTPPRQIENSPSREIVEKESVQSPSIEESLASNFKELNVTSSALVKNLMSPIAEVSKTYSEASFRQPIVEECDELTDEEEHDFVGEEVEEDDMLEEEEEEEENYYERDQGICIRN
jgi:hypothetical protein